MPRSAFPTPKQAQKIGKEIRALETSDELSNLMAACRDHSTREPGDDRPFTATDTMVSAASQTLESVRRLLSEAESLMRTCSLQLHAAEDVHKEQAPAPATLADVTAYESLLTYPKGGMSRQEHDTELRKAVKPLANAGMPAKSIGTWLIGLMEDGPAPPELDAGCYVRHPDFPHVGRMMTLRAYEHDRKKNLYPAAIGEQAPGKILVHFEGRRVPKIAAELAVDERVRVMSGSRGRWETITKINRDGDTVTVDYDGGQITIPAAENVRIYEADTTIWLDATDCTKMVRRFTLIQGRTKQLVALAHERAELYAENVALNADNAEKSAV